jgi:hypothetical protein
MLFNTLWHYLWAAVIVLFVWAPVIVLFIDVSAMLEHVDILGGIHLAQDTLGIGLSCAVLEAPYRLYRDQPQHHFWEVHPMDWFIEDFMSVLVDFHNAIGELATGFGGKGSAFAVPFVDHSKVTYFDFLNGKFSLLFALQTAPMIAIAMIISDFAVLLPDTHTVEYFFQFCAHYRFVLVSTIATITAQQSEESPSISFFVILIALMVLGLCCLYFIFTAEERRISLFLEVFIDTHQSELILIRDQLKLLCNNLGVKEPKTHQKCGLFVGWRFSSSSSILPSVSSLHTSASCTAFRSTSARSDSFRMRRMRFSSLRLMSSSTRCRGPSGPISAPSSTGCR